MYHYLRLLSALCVVSGVAAAITVSSPPAPGAPAAGVSRVDRVDDQLATVWVYSPSMRRHIPNQVLLPASGRPAPVLYLLNGRGGGVDGDSWLRQTRYRDFFANKNVYVVSPVGGRFSWSANWRRPDPVLGVNAWETYLTRELPHALSSRFAVTGRAAIAGVSMTGSTALDIAGHAGQQFTGVASYSGCPVTSGPVGQAIVTAVTGFGGGNAANLYGGPTDPAWADHDPSRHPGRLRGKAVYLGSASGVPGAIDGAPSPALLAGPAQVETITTWCSDQMGVALRGAQIPHVRKVFNSGAHTWNLFEAELRDSWTTLGPALIR